MQLFRGVGRTRRQFVCGLAAGQSAPIYNPRRPFPLEPQGCLHARIHTVRNQFPGDGAEHQTVEPREHQFEPKQHREVRQLCGGRVDRRRHGLSQQCRRQQSDPVFRVWSQGLASDQRPQTHRGQWEQTHPWKRRQNLARTDYSQRQVCQGEHHLGTIASVAREAVCVSHLWRLWSQVSKVGRQPKSRGGWARNQEVQDNQWLRLHHIGIGRHLWQVEQQGSGPVGLGDNQSHERQPQRTEAVHGVRGRPDQNSPHAQESR